MLFVFVLLLTSTRAQRPSNASLCDYYAETLYGSNSSTTQYKLIQSIITLAYAGGTSLSNATGVTGILNPGTFMNFNVDLQPWFNGSIASTNLNNQPVEIEWIDEGIGPLDRFLIGATPSVQPNSSSNEFRLFTHFFTAFSHIFGCTLPPPPMSSSGTGPLNLAYVHKFMNLNFTDLGYMIDQVSLSTQYYGFSSEDTETLSTQLNSMYNVRCSPPVNGQLLSLCQASSCPLAVPSPDCEAYVDLGPNGSSGNSSTTSTAASTSPSSTSLGSSSSSSSIPPLPKISTASSSILITPLPSVTPAHSSSSSTLSAGAIAGISIGSAAVLILGIGILVYFIRRPKLNGQQQPPRTEPSEFNISTPGYDYASRSGTSYVGSQNLQPGSEAPIAEMESPMPSPPMGKPPVFNRFGPDM